ncbi:MAG: hypothetical protein ACRENG_10515 [bacterium]
MTEFHYSSLAIVLSIVLVAAVFAQEPTNCQTCHGDKDLAVSDSAGVERSLFVDIEKMAASVHAGFDCVTCHPDVKEIPHSEQLAPAACQTCHDIAGAELTESVHGKASDGDAPACGSCHGSPRFARQPIRFRSCIRAGSPLPVGIVTPTPRLSKSIKYPSKIR